MVLRRRRLIRILKLLDLGVVVASFAIALRLEHIREPGARWLLSLDASITVLDALCVAGFLGLWHLCLTWFGLYRSYRLAPRSRELRQAVAATAVVTLVSATVASALGYTFISASFALSYLIVTAIALAGGRLLFRAAARRLRRSGRNMRNIIVIGDGKPAIELSAELATREELGYRVLQVIDAGDDVEHEDRAQVARRVLGDLERLLAINPVDEVFLSAALETMEFLARPIVALCDEVGVLVRAVTTVAEPVWGSAVLDELDSKPVVTIFPAKPDIVMNAVKRSIDLVCAAVGLVLLAPVFVVVALAIKIDSRGPVFFVQKRVGLNRHRFRFYKFRTMDRDAEDRQASVEPLNEADGNCFKITNDPRITRLGRWLRRTSVDELPQLYNVLKGEMSLVGPRPLSIRDAELIDVLWHRRRFSVKPGITCLWQVRSRLPVFDEWMKADLEYVDRRSLLLDLAILLRTIPAVVSGAGAS